MFVPGDILSQLSVLPPADCPHCAAFPSIPCIAHRDNDDGHLEADNRSMPLFKPF